MGFYVLNLCQYCAHIFKHVFFHQVRFCTCKKETLQHRWTNCTRWWWGSCALSWRLEEHLGFGYLLAGSIKATQTPCDNKRWLHRAMVQGIHKKYSRESLQRWRLSKAPWKTQLLATGMRHKVRRIQEKIDQLNTYAKNIHGMGCLQQLPSCQSSSVTFTRTISSHATT
jgi:hypothetical protein